MKKLWSVMAAGAFALNVSACGLESIVDDIADELDNLATQAKVEAIFNEAITSVTFVSLDAALSAVTAEVSAAPQLRPLADEAKTVNIDVTTTDAEGATVTVTGTMTVAEAATATTVTVNLQSTWTGNVDLGDGTTVQATSNSTVSGTVTIEAGENDSVVTLEFANQGNLSVDGSSYPFSVTVTWNSETNQMTVNGLVNGVEIVPVTTELKVEEIPAPVPDEEEITIYGSCYDAQYGDICHEYTGSYFSDWESSSICQELGLAKQSTPCDVTGFSGACLLNEGTDTEEYRYGVGINEGSCGEISGTWLPFPAAN